MSFNLKEFTNVALSSKANLVYSVLLLINYFAYGITANILGATLVDLSYIYDVSIDTMSYSAVATAIGYMTGALVGWLYKWANRQLVLIFLVSVFALTITLVPWYGQLPVALVAILVNGIGAGGLDSSSGFWMVEMWPVGNAAMLQLMQCMYGAGAVAAPLLVAPYVHGANATNITREDRVHSLAVPYLMNGIIQAIVPTCWIVLFFTNRYKVVDVNSANLKSNYEEIPDHSKKNIPNRKMKLALCGVALAAYGSAELGWFNFSTTMYQFWGKNGGIELSAATADHVLAIMSVCYALGRLATAFITLKLTPDCIISYHFVLIYMSLTVQYFGRANLTIVTASNAVLGYGFSAMWPAIFAFTERHLQLSDRVCSVYSFMAGTCSLIIPLIMGQSFKARPLLLFYLNGIFLTIGLAAFICVSAWIWFDNSDSKNKTTKT